MDKIKSYIGFAIKARKIVFGQDNILKSKNCKLIISSQNLSQNALQKLTNTQIKLIILPNEVYQSLELKGLVVGITDQNLANAINILAQ